MLSRYRSLYYYINNFLNKNSVIRIAAFDLDNTLIKTKSGKTFSVSADDWEFFNEHVPAKLHSLSKEGYQIVIFSNQLGITTGKVNIDKFQQKLSQILTELNTIIFVCIATCKDKYRKPNTGMWGFMIDQLGIEIDISNSFYVGDALGRPGDFSDSDLVFGKTIGLAVKSPEDFFSN